MSQRIIKETGGIIDPNDAEILQLVVMKSGKIQLIAPHMNPRDVCKMLNNLSTDLMFNLFQVAEQPMIEPVSPLHKV